MKEKVRTTAVEQTGIKIGPPLFDQTIDFVSSKARSCTASKVFFSLLSTLKETPFTYLSYH